MVQVERAETETPAEAAEDIQEQELRGARRGSRWGLPARCDERERRRVSAATAAASGQPRADDALPVGLAVVHPFVGADEVAGVGGAQRFAVGESHYPDADEGAHHPEADGGAHPRADDDDSRSR